VEFYVVRELDVGGRRRYVVFKVEGKPQAVLRGGFKALCSRYSFEYLDELLPGAGACVGREHLGRFMDETEFVNTLRAWAERCSARVDSVIADRIVEFLAEPPSKALRFRSTSPAVVKGVFDVLVKLEPCAEAVYALLSDMYWFIVAFKDIFCIYDAILDMVVCSSYDPNKVDAEAVARLPREDKEFLKRAVKMLAENTHLHRHKLVKKALKAVNHIAFLLELLP